MDEPGNSGSQSSDSQEELVFEPVKISA